MAYSELIKDINRIRPYIRDFYVYGLYTRDEYAARYGISPRSYDNERRRVESWMQEYLDFYQNSSGKKVFLSVDGSQILHNPLYRAFKAKSFTKNDVLLHFFLMDLFSDGRPMEQSEVMSALETRYLNDLSYGDRLDQKTVWLKLKDLAALGLLAAQKAGRTVRYRIVQENVDLSLPGFQDALHFFSEAAPLGVIGSFLLDKRAGEGAEDQNVPSCFRFRHHYLMHAIDSEIMSELLVAINEKRKIRMRVDNAFQGSMKYATVPIRIYVSTENGREYLLSWNDEEKRFYFSRLDRIIWVVQMDQVPEWDHLKEDFEQNHQNRLWGVSFGGLDAELKIEHLEMEIRAGENESYIVRRIEREKRCGTVRRIAQDRYLFSADVYDAMEILPWICSFTGRIVRLACDNDNVIRKYQNYLARMAAGYREEEITCPESPDSENHDQPTENTENGNASNVHVLSAGEKAELARGRHDLVFHEVYGAYYNAIARTLSLAVRKELTPRKLKGVVRNEAFSESLMYLPERLLSEEWMLLDDELGTCLKKEPTMPLTLIQKRWLRSLMNDPKIHLFMDDDVYEALLEQLEGVCPLFEPDTFYYFDRFSDGDPICDPEYICSFRKALKAIRKKGALSVTYQNQYGVVSELQVDPGTIEYSAREDKFRVYAGHLEESEWDEPLRLNMGRVISCDILPDQNNRFPDEEGQGEKVQRDRVVIELVDDENTLERAMFHFSFLEKMTERIDEGKFRMTLYYPRSDEKEIMIRILSFGHQLSVISEGYIRQEIERRLIAQTELLDQA